MRLNVDPIEPVTPTDRTAPGYAIQVAAMGQHWGGRVVAADADTVTIRPSSTNSAQVHREKLPANGLLTVPRAAITDIPVSCRDCGNVLPSMEGASTRDGVVRCQHCHHHVVHATPAPATCERCGATRTLALWSGVRWLCADCREAAEARNRFLDRVVEGSRYLWR